MKKYTKVMVFSLLLAVFSSVFATSVVQAAGFMFSNDLRVGASGADVVELQTWLIGNGYRIPAIENGAIAKGYFGGQTRAAVIHYQATVGLPATGFVGPMTRGQLNNNTPPPPSPLKIISPNGGESLKRNSSYAIQWTAPQYFKATYADISLVPYYPPCTGQICPMHAVRAPYSVATNIGIDNHSYVWYVGSAPSSLGCGAVACGPQIPDGKYTIQICESGTSICDSSDAPFTIYTAADTRTPVINSVTVPTTLGVGQLATLTIQASDPQNKALQYYVRWGDEAYYRDVTTVGATYTGLPTTGWSQSSTFTHTYSTAGTYNISVTVSNDLNLYSVSTVTVKVTESAQPKITVTSPNGGERWLASSTQMITWSDNSTDPNAKVDLYLGDMTPQPCPAGRYCILGFGYNQKYILDKNIPTKFAYNWIVATDIANVPIPQGNYLVQICQAGSTVNCDTSNEVFTILR